jgi:hypothetical protein
MRAAVGHLSRNIRFKAEEKDNWGGRLLVTKFTDFVNQVDYIGNVTLQGVEISGYGKWATDQASLDFVNNKGQDN